MTLKWARRVETEEDRKTFQEGVDGLASWSKDWQLLFNVGNCKIMGRKNNTPATHCKRHPPPGLKSSVTQRMEYNWRK